MNPFIKWAGGKRWLIQSNQVVIPEFSGRYIEPFLGGGALFFHIAPKSAILSDINPKLIEAYQAIKDDWKQIEKKLRYYQRKHSKDFYYQERSLQRKTPTERAAQFLYLNRTCYNGLYRENLNGVFNVPIGTKNNVFLPDDNFELASLILGPATLKACDFEETLDHAEKDDLVFLDPPYTTAHNLNGFVKYNQNIFSWDDQIRLQKSVKKAKNAGAKILLTNANHSSILELYRDIGEPRTVHRYSVLSGKAKGRGSTTEVLYEIC